MANRNSNTTTSSDGSDSMFVKDRKSDELTTSLSPAKAAVSTMSAIASPSFSGHAAASGSTNSRTTAGGGVITQVSRWSYSTTDSTGDGDSTGLAMSTKIRTSVNTTDSNSVQAGPGRWSEGTFGSPVEPAKTTSHNAGMAPDAEAAVLSQTLATLEEEIIKKQGAEAMGTMYSSSESYKNRRKQASNDKSDDVDS